MKASLGIPEVQKILKWADKNTRDFPWRHTSDPYEVLVAEILLRRTTASAVARVFKDFLKKYPSLQRLSNADEDELRKNINTLGYHHRRAKLFKEIASSVLLKFGSLPNSAEKLLSIKEIGLYTQAAILSIGYNEPVPMVDSNVLRILNRVYGKKFTQPRAFTLLSNILPDDFKKFNFALLDLGALICKHKPLCEQCPLQHSCYYASEN